MRSRSRPSLAVLWAALVSAVLHAPALAASRSGAADGPTAPAIVYVVPVDGIIDLGLAPFIQRVLGDAGTARARAVILEVNTLGGRVDAAILIRDALLDTRVPTVAFVNKRAISAGALISLGAHTIAMTEGATIGAATPVQAGAGGAQAVGEKTVSYMRKEFRATAESRKRPPLVAEAMVDPDVAIPGLIDKGKLLTLTTSEALRHRVADFRADSVDAVLDRLGLAGAEVRRPALNWAEQVVRALTHPIFSSILMTVGLLGLLVELRTPGFGVPGAVGIASLGAFFLGHWLVRLAGWEEILLVAVGVALLALEVFVLPGFGVAGVLGLLALLGGLSISLVGAGATWTGVLAAAGRVAVSLLLALVGFLVLLRILPRLPFGRALVLDAVLSRSDAAAVPADADRPRATGIALTPLRPAGIAELDGARVDVVSQGEYIAAGEPLEVVRTEGHRVVVRRPSGAPKERP
jgi:membrane-bound serine protease (ClpP class)